MEVIMAGKESHKVAQRILDTYNQRTGGSRARDMQSKNYLPGGDTRSSTYFFPYPIYMERGEGCYIYDCDGNEYIDLINNYTSLIHGHAHPRIIEATSEELQKGSALGTPVDMQFKLAEHLCSRIPSMEMLRYCSSGTEATLFAMRAARAVTGREIIIKMDGGYHGSHDYVRVNLSLDPDGQALPMPCLEGPGIPSGVLDGTLVAPFNDLDAIEALIDEHKGEIAGIITEPMLGANGLVPPKPGYLKGLRALADKCGALLIFDEIVTFRLDTGGMQAMSGVEPDLTTLGKIIGGGFGIAAFGGKKEVMAPFDPAHPKCLYHAGTFNGNNIALAAGLSAMEMYDKEAIDRVNELGDRLRDGFNQAFKRAEINGQITGLGSLVGVHWRGGEIVNARDVKMGLASAAELPKLLHLEMLNRGMYSAARGQYVISTPMTEGEVDKAVEAFGDTLEILTPYIAEAAPHLLTH